MLPALQIAASLLLLYFGGEFLVRGAAALALRLGISTLAIGLTVVAFGTSAPELAVSLQAARSGANDISVANVVGSNIANIALILGVAALLHPLAAHAKIVRLDGPIMLASSGLLLGMLADGRLSRGEGLLLLTLLGAYTLFTFWQARRETRAVRAELTTAAPQQAPGMAINAALVIGGLALLVAGGQLLVTAAVDIATDWGMSQAAIGLTIVAVGTSLPELTTSVIASLRRQGDIAVGNVVGSNIFNTLGILGVTASWHPLQQGGIAWLDLFLMVGLAALLMLALWIRPVLGRLSGLLLLGSYFAYSSYLLLR